MSLRRLATLALAGMLLLPAIPALAQIQIADGWEASDDGLAFATNDTFDTPPGWSTVTSDGFPAVISEIPGPNMLYRVDGTLETGTRVVNLHDSAGLPWLDDGRTPVLAKAVVDDDGATWMRQQHVVSMPADCPKTWAQIDRCVPFDTIAELIDLAAPDGTPVDPAPAAAGFAVGSFASSGTVDRAGTLFSFAGDATVGTSVKVRDDDTILVRGEAQVGDAVGGRLRGYDARVIELTNDGMAAPRVAGLQSLLAQARAARDAGASANGPNQRVLQCPASRRGWVLSQFLVNRVGRNIGPSVHPGLDGGIAVFVSEIIPFDCGAAPNGQTPLSIPPDGPAAGIYCASTRSVHKPFTIQVDGRTLTWASYVEQFFGIVTVGISPEAQAVLHARAGGANDGDIFSADLAGTPLDPASQTGPVLWLGETRAGINTYGPKRYRDLQFTADGLVIDLLEQQRGLFGEAFEVGPSQKPRSNCPDFDFTVAPGPDGFDPGAVPSWQSPNPD